MSRKRSRRLAPTLLTLALAVLGAAAAQAYTVYLKDGSRIVAKEKYRIQGDRAYLILENGTNSFLKASEIDVARTEKANAGGNYGSAYEIETLREVPAVVDKTERKETLDDLIRAGKANPTERPATRRAETASGPRKGRMASGAVDFATLPAVDFPDATVAAELVSFYGEQGIKDVVVVKGTVADHALVRAITESEGAVFRTLAASAVLLSDVRRRTPTRLAAILSLIHI